MEYIKRLSHVGLHTSDLDVSLKWYTEVLGLKEAFRLHRDDRVVIIYLQLTPETFIELFAPRPDGQKPPQTHFSIEVTDIEAAVEDLKKRLPPESLRKPDINTGKDGSRLFNFFDPDNHRIEFQQFPPTSQQAQAMQRAAEQKDA
jgi:catechol 2,3-dioxygenase-like lactoylglutathione lyase family enzyme